MNEPQVIVALIEPLGGELPPFMAKVTTLQVDPPVELPPIEGVKPPPAGGGWGYHPLYGWGYKPKQGEAGPKDPPENEEIPKPPPRDGGWGWWPPYGWMFFPAGGKPRPIQPPDVDPPPIVIVPPGEGVIKPPPPGGGWGYVYPYGWVYWPGPGGAGPK